jgi:hypothetical protein
MQNRIAESQESGSVYAGIPKERLSAAILYKVHRT